MTSSDMLPKREQERDLELDKRIEALRRKNEALMKRHKEVEEDRKRAEEEGMALQSHKSKAEDLTITISKSTCDSRVVVTKPFSGDSPSGKGQQEAGPDKGEDAPPQSAGRGHRKQLMVTMAGKKGKRVVSERSERRPGSSDIKSPTDDGQASRVESAGRGSQPPHMTKRDTAEQDGLKSGQQHTEDHHRLSEQCQESESLQASTDLNIPTSKEEQEEYVRWKKEREQIDKERVARHKNAKGQWKRAWDMDKNDNMFSDKSVPDRDWGPSSRGGRNARRGPSRAGHEKRGKDKGAKDVLVMSSKAKGKDRLTGRARRWQANEDGENLQSADTTLEEFLEELDAVTDVEVDNHKDEDLKLKLSLNPNSLSKSEEVSGSTTPAQEQAEASSPRGSEKKVRFSEALVQGAHTKQTTGSQDSACSESPSARSLKASSPKKNPHKVQGPQQPLESAKQDDVRPQDQGGGLSAPPVAQQQTSETECTKKDSSLPAAPSSPPAENACASRQQSSVQPVELAKCNISNTNTEELIDSGLSVLSLESGETHPTHSTSSDKAREHGKIV
ncbi:coiled-coil domain-containing protein 9B isoform X2 [Clinocottus analis]|uniref:coiled-coil domain-containing protein 9B isoform X2 n=1 Tax=Clinocottus analis TaxID=304258 RepID=UPI0035BEB6D9